MVMRKLLIAGVGSLLPIYLELRQYRILKVSEELAVKSIRDEIIWSSYASLGRHLGRFIPSS